MVVERAEARVVGVPAVHVRVSTLARLVLSDAHVHALAQLLRTVARRRGPLHRLHVLPTNSGNPPPTCIWAPVSRG